MANIEVIEAPVTAFEMACNIAQVVKTLVGRPIHVAIVKGLKRKLQSISNVLHSQALHLRRCNR